MVDFPSLTTSPVGRNCLLTVDGTLVFSGTLDGETSGTTTVLVFASCAAVIANPPGTFPDIFRFISDPATPFVGDVDGEPTTTAVTYQGRNAAGGTIDGKILLRGDAHGVLDVTATVGVGGSYDGFVKR